MKNWFKVGLLTVIVSCPLFAPAPAAAQTDAEYLSAVSFRFNNPGARARGLGGAFVALADDATAAVVNPAGLTYLGSSEFSLQYEADEDEFPAPRVETGARDGGAVFVPEYAPRRQTVSTEQDVLSFASFIWPVKASTKRHLVLGFFYSKPLDTTAGGDDQNLGIEIDSATFPGIDPRIAFRPVSSFVDAKNEVAGVSAGFRLGDRFALGGSVGLSRFEFLGVAVRSDVLLPVELNTETSVVDREDDIFATVGGLWRITDRVILGGSWQLQTQYDMENSLDVLGSNYKTFSSEFTIPTRWTLGLAIKPADGWVIAVEGDRIEYSDLFADPLSESFFGEFSDDPDYGYAIDDVTEIHLGAEYSFQAGGSTWSVRAGAWRDQTHPPFYSGTDPLHRAWAPRLAEDVDHLTAGLGFDSGRVVVDLAVDHSSDAGTDVLASLVFRPGKSQD